MCGSLCSSLFSGLCLPHALELGSLSLIHLTLHSRPPRANCLGWPGLGLPQGPRLSSFYSKQTRKWREKKASIPMSLCSPALRPPPHWESTKVSRLRHVGHVTSVLVHIPWTCWADAAILAGWLAGWLAGRVPPLVLNQRADIDPWRGYPPIKLRNGDWCLPLFLLAGHLALY